MFGAWGGSLGASVRANVRVRLAGSGRFYLECTVGGPVVYMGRSRNGETKSVRGKDLRELFGQASRAVGLHLRLQDHAGGAEVRSLVWSCALGLGHGKV